MPLKSKVKFGAGNPPPDPNTTGSDKDNAKDNVSVHKRKSRKSKHLRGSHAALSDEEEEIQERKRPEVKLVEFPDLNKEVSDGSISDTEIPRAELSHGKGKKICGGGKDDPTGPIEPIACNVKAKLTASQKISCLRSDNQEYATTDYMTATAAHFIPTMLHPLNATVSSTTRHREYTEYLKNSGFLKMFGACILNVYRMWKWPPPEKLLEEILTAMGYELPSRIQHTELTEMKTNLQAQLKALSIEKNELMKALDEYEDSPAKYDLLDQDQVLPPTSQKSCMKFDLMNEIFKHMDLKPDYRDSLSCDVKVISRARKVPDSMTLPIPYHDKRMLK